jgi:acyl-coenzyme A thioesterase PaaI-like protein
MILRDEGRALRSAASVEPVGHGHFSLNLSPFYTVMGRPHGGYLQCVMARGALAAASEDGSVHQHVTAISTNFIRALELGRADIRTEVRYVGRGASFVYGALYQDDVLGAESLVTLGTLRQDSVIRYQDAAAPSVTPLEQCGPPTGRDDMNIMRVVEQRLDPGSAGWLSGELSSRGEVYGWLRLDDGDASWTPWSLLFAGDALPPATFPLGSSGWVPTLQLSSRVSRVPRGPWLRSRQWAAVIADGLVDERCELFDETGALVASSSQLAMVRFGEGR